MVLGSSGVAASRVSNVHAHCPHTPHVNPPPSSYARAAATNETHGLADANEGFSGNDGYANDANGGFGGNDGFYANGAYGANGGYDGNDGYANDGFDDGMKATSLYMAHA